MIILRSRRRLVALTILAVVAVLFCVAVFAYWQATSGPRFRGKSVERWVASFSHEPEPEVINAFGVSACPELIRVLEKEETKFAGVWVRLPQGLRQKLRHLDPSRLSEHQRLAATWLKVLGTDAEAVVPQLGKVSSRKPEFASTLAFVGKNQPVTAKMLTPLLEHTNTMVREDVALTPGVLRSNAFPLLPALTNMIVNHPRQAPFNAILGVGLIGPSASNAVPLLISFLGKSNFVDNTLSALENIGTGATAAIPALCALLEDRSRDKQLKIVECLYAMGRGASQALPHLRRLQSAETNLLQLLVSLTLAQIEEDRGHAAEALARSLSGRQIRTDDQTFTIVLPDTRTTLGSYVGLRHAQFAALLAADYPDRPELLPHLKNALHDSGNWFQVLAARAIWRHTRSTDQILPPIYEALLSDGLPLHYAVETLKELPLKKEDLPPLIEFVEDMKRPWATRMAILKVIKTADPGFQLKPVPELTLPR